MFVVGLWLTSNNTECISMLNYNLNTIALLQKVVILRPQGPISMQAPQMQRGNIHQINSWDHEKPDHRSLIKHIQLKRLFKQSECDSTWPVKPYREKYPTDTITRSAEPHSAVLSAAHLVAWENWNFEQINKKNLSY